MPLNTLRLNHQPSSHPNDRIVFIKPLPRPPTQQTDSSRAELILKAIAAQCLPIMKSHFLSVTTLEEYEPNPEFIGRNFNNGEVIQLVLRSKRGGWLPLRMIQMVMMHELAHNTHMNHGKGFWAARNLYAGEMRGLWGRGYTGEGLWGGGRSLGDVERAVGGEFMRGEEVGELPLCGGTFRSRRKKRKVGGEEELTWKEKRDRRIEKKFGKNGMALGEDEDARLMLEINSKGAVGAKPRVAQSKRGRELRAAAALARFSTNKQEVEKFEEVKTEDDETEYEEVDNKQEDAKDINGVKITDGSGQGMIRICEEEDEDDAQVKNEIEELTTLNDFQLASDAETETASEAEGDKASGIPTAAGNSIENVARTDTLALDKVEPSTRTSGPSDLTTHDELATPRSPLSAGPSSSRTIVSCSVCSLDNEDLRSTCLACSNVLDPRKDPQHWNCTSESCAGSGYINAGDCGVCGLCGVRRPPQQAKVSMIRPQGNGTVSSHIAYL